MTMDNYECTLNSESEAKAIEELNEDPRERLGAVQAFRTWILQQPHIKCPTDTKYLLRFLRAAHFSQLEARNILTKYYTNKSEKPTWFSDIDVRDPKMQAFLRTGYLVPLPGVKDDGRKVILARIGALNPQSKDYDKVTVIRTYITAFLHLLHDENIQVNGFELFLDLTGLTLSHNTYMGISTIKELIERSQGSKPGRLKLFHLYNTGGIFETVYKAVKPLVPKKIENRILFHEHNLENVYKNIPQRMLPEEYLPDDYTGPCAGSIESISEKYIEELQRDDVRQRLLEESKTEYASSVSANQNLPHQPMIGLPP